MRKTKKNRYLSNQAIIHSYNNVVKCSHNPGEKKEHRKIKYLLADFMYENGIQFATEASIIGGRADFFVKDWYLIFEILNTEEIKKFKKKKYNMPTIPIPVITKEEEILKMLQELKDTEGEAWQYYKEKFIGGTKNDSL